MTAASRVPKTKIATKRTPASVVHGRPPVLALYTVREPAMMFMVQNNCKARRS